MSKPIQFYIRAVEDHDRDWVLDLITKAWGDDQIVVHQELYFPHLLAGFVACRNQDHRIGLVTYKISKAVCEIITLNSLIENQGVGTSLLEEVVRQAKRHGCAQLILTTTNDNQRAIDFYSSRGLGLKEIRQGAVDKSREIKASIPRYSPSGIAIQDEWVFELALDEED